jgi:hypothetical protein
LARLVPGKVALSTELQYYDGNKLDGQLYEHTATYIGQIDLRLSAHAKKGIQKGNWKNINGIIITIELQGLLPTRDIAAISSTVRVLTPI